MVDFVFITWDVYGAWRNRHPKNWFEAHQNTLHQETFKFDWIFSHFLSKRTFHGFWITKNIKVSNKNVAKEKIKVGKLEGATVRLVNKIHATRLYAVDWNRVEVFLYLFWQQS